MKKGRTDAGQLNSKPNVMICLAAVLLLLVGISTNYVSGLYAKYTTNRTGTDGARVASFEVHATDGKDSAPTMDLGDVVPIAKFVLVTDNKSEVAVRCSINITFDEVLLDGVDITLSEDGIKDNSDMSFTVTSDRKSASLDSAFDMSANSSSVTNYILFTPSEDIYDELGNGQNYNSANPMKVEVVFEQID